MKTSQNLPMIICTLVCLALTLLALVLAPFGIEPLDSVGMVLIATCGAALMLTAISQVR